MCEMRVPVDFEAQLCLLSVIFMSKKVQKSELNIMQSAFNGTLAEIAFSFGRRPEMCLKGTVCFDHRDF